MKRTFLALGVGTAVFALVLGAAATLPLKGGAVQQGSDLTLYCQDAVVQVQSWGVNPGPENEGVTFVQLQGIDEAGCQNNRLMGAVYDGGGSIIGYTTTIDPGTGAAYPYGNACLIDGTTTDSPARDCRRPDGTYKLELVTTTGHYGVPADQIEQFRLWIEGPSGD